MAYAIIRSGGKQFRVEEGGTVRIPTLDAQAGDTVELEALVVGGAKEKSRAIQQGNTLIEQGAAGDEIFLVLDGMFAVEVDGRSVAQVGPGAIVGERAAVEQGPRTATLRALTACRVVSVPRRYADDRELSEIALGHRREEGR